LQRLWHIAGALDQRAAATGAVGLAGVPRLSVEALSVAGLFAAPSPV